MSFKRFFPWITFLTLLLACTLPLFVARNLPLVDYPTHLARMYILSHHANDGFLSNIYELSLLPRPNLGMDLIVFVLAKFVSVETASRTFVVFSMAITLSGVAILNRAIHREWSSISILLGAVLLYNWVFAYGFMNFLFGLGIMLWAIGFWLMMADRSAVIRIMGGTFLASFIFLAHIVPFVVFAVALGGIGLHRSITQWRIDPCRLPKEFIIGVIVCGLPALVFLYFTPDSGDIVTGFYFGPWSLKLVALFRTPLGMNFEGDLAVLIGVLTLFGWVSRRGNTSLAPSLLIVLLFVGLVFICAPNSSELGFYLNERIYLIFLFLSVAALKIKISGQLPCRVITGLLVVSIWIRSLMTAGDWIKCDESINRARHAFSTLEGPAVLYVAAIPTIRNSTGLLDKIASRYQFFKPSVQHIGAYAALNKEIFVPMVYAQPSLQPIQISSQFLGLAKIQGFNSIQLNTDYELIELVRKLRQTKAELPVGIQRVYLYVYGVAKADPALVGVTLIAEDPDFVIYKL